MGNIIVKDGKAAQEDQDKAQEMHGKHVMAVLEEQQVNAENFAVSQQFNTKQTVWQHEGKHPAEQNKSDEMEALKVGKSFEEPPNLLKIEQTSNVTHPDGSVTEEVTDVIQVPELRAATGRGVPAGGGIGELTEPQKTAMTVEENVDQVEPQTEEGGTAQPKAKKKAKKSE